MKITIEQAQASFRTLNNNGEGFAPESAHRSTDINEIPELGRLIYAAQTTSDVAVYEATDGAVYAVADAEGPWAVRVA